MKSRNWITRHWKPVSENKTPNRTNTNGIILWEGESVLDRSPIVAVLTGLDKRSQNSKTGNSTEDMLQIFIIRQDIDPVTAQNLGLDVATCGSCILRPYLRHLRLLLGISKPCYVETSKSVNSVFQSYTRGGYLHLNDIDTEDVINQIGTRRVRIGAYGDGMAIPFDSWKLIMQRIGYPLSTGYTHQWKRKGSEVYRNMLMASCDTVADKAKAHSKGFTCFTIGDDDAIQCPAQVSPESNSCATCGSLEPLCSGGSGLDIGVTLH